MCSTTSTMLHIKSRVKFIVPKTWQQISAHVFKGHHGAHINKGRPQFLEPASSRAQRKRGGETMSEIAHPTKRMTFSGFFLKPFKNVNRIRKKIKFVGGIVQNDDLCSVLGVLLHGLGSECQRVQTSTLRKVFYKGEHLCK